VVLSLLVRQSKYEQRRLAEQHAHAGNIGGRRQKDA
jgi:hypothetical protein